MVTAASEGSSHTEGLELEAFDMDQVGALAEVVGFEEGSSASVSVSLSESETESDWLPVSSP